MIMGNILKDIYTDTALAPLLGLKGGTAAYFFYKLPRFSVDLDFDLFVLDEALQNQVFEKIEQILKQYGTIKDKKIKQNTIFLLLSYGELDRNIKIEISTRQLIPDLKNYYQLKEYLGISMLVGAEKYLFSAKLIALSQRKETAARDIYDIWFFAKNNFDIDPEIIRIRTGKESKAYLSDCIAIINKFKDNQILKEIGELLSEKEKNWIKNNLKKDVIFLLKNYISVLK